MKTDPVRSHFLLRNIIRIFNFFSSTVTDIRDREA